MFGKCALLALMVAASGITTSGAMAACGGARTATVHGGSTGHAAGGMVHAAVGGGSASACGATTTHVVLSAGTHITSTNTGAPASVGKRVAHAAHPAVTRAATMLHHRHV